MVGETFEHYRILQRVGEGGMGTVYRAFDTELERDVALKVLRADLSGQPDVTKRFRAEAVTLARLSHPHIATLFGLARHGTQMCMVMEYVQGATLADLLRQDAALDVERATRLASQVLSALDYAHAAGVVHRDIKPSNVIVSTADTVKVLDFGIARVLHADRMTRQGFILGTPQYMAPEQIRGADLDGRADVYAVGVLLYEMVARRLPFDADNELALMYAHLEGRLVPLAEAAPGAPAWLCSVVARALARAPDDRFASAAEFRAALDRREVVPVGVPVAVPTQIASRIPDAAAPASAAASQASRFARVRSWLLPRFTWEYYAGPDGLLTVRRALRMPDARTAMTPMARGAAERLTGSVAPPSSGSGTPVPVDAAPAGLRRRALVLSGAMALAVGALALRWGGPLTPQVGPGSSTC